MADTFGRYIVRGEIGRGGMATVYQALDPRFEREVAIKVLPPQMLHDPTFRSRFDREAKIIAALEHPGIVPVYDFGEQNGQPYLVMRYMSGGSLEGRIKLNTLSLPEAAQILSRLAPALDEAHSRGIVHRDLKPGNILFDQRGDAYLSDFGIVRLSEATTSLTGGAIIGTPAYMSPEQGRGDPTIDWRSDIYSLGAILYHMLCGKLPYEATTPTGIIIKHITEPVPNILNVRPDLPPEVQRVIDRAMAKNKEERYEKASEMARKVAEVAAQVPTERGAPVYRPVATLQDGTAVEAAPPSFPGVAEPSPRQVPAPFQPGRAIEAPRQKSWLWLAGGIAGLVCLCLGGMGFFWASRGFLFQKTPVGPLEVKQTAERINKPTATSWLAAAPPLEPINTSTPRPAAIPPPSASLTPTPMTISITTTPMDMALSGYTLGASPGGRGIMMYFAGNLGDTSVVLVGSLDGTQTDTGEAINRTIDLYAQDPSLVPKGMVVYLIPSLNPDGNILNNRYNANGVDLNRNWDTKNWRSDPPVPEASRKEGAGGLYPFSEPETKALSEFLLKLKNEGQHVVLVVCHSTISRERGLILPGYSSDGVDPVSDELAYRAAEILTYDYSDLWDYATPGEAINWSVDVGIPAIDILWPKGSPPSAKDLARVVDLFIQ